MKSRPSSRGNTPPLFFDNNLRFAGLFLSAGATGPLPVAIIPWHCPQYHLYSNSPVIPCFSPAAAALPEAALLERQTPSKINTTTTAILLTLASGIQFSSPCSRSRLSLKNREPSPPFTGGGLSQNPQLCTIQPFFTHYTTSTLKTTPSLYP